MHVDLLEVFGAVAVLRPSSSCCTFRCPAFEKNQLFGAMDLSGARLREVRGSPTRGLTARADVLLNLAQELVDLLDPILEPLRSRVLQPLKTGLHTVDGLDEMIRNPCPDACLDL